MLSSFIEYRPVFPVEYHPWARWHSVAFWGAGAHLKSAMVATLERNLADVDRRIAAACIRVGRSPGSVCRIAVTKYVDYPILWSLYELGVRDFGESRPQALWERKAKLPDDCRWHLIGPLQSNKVRRTLPMIFQLHSLDRLSLAETIDREARRLGLVLPATIEVNVSGEATKGGFAGSDMPRDYPALIAFEGIRILGLMTMAPLEDRPDACRPTFAGLRALRDELRRSFPAGPELNELSMGMTNDFEVAVEEGATQVRIGTALFVGLD